MEVKTSKKPSVSTSTEAKNGLFKSLKPSLDKVPSWDWYWLSRWLVSDDQKFWYQFLFLPFRGTWWLFMLYIEIRKYGKIPEHWKNHEKGYHRKKKRTWILFRLNWRVWLVDNKANSSGELLHQMWYKSDRTSLCRDEHWSTWKDLVFENKVKSDAQRV